MGEDFVRGTPPPEAGHVPPRLRVLNVRPGTPATVVLLANHCVGVPFHWRPAGQGLPARSVGCPAPGRACSHCHLELLWSGYVGVYDLATSGPAALCLTADAVAQLRWRSGTGKNGSRPALRFSKWRVMRTSSRPNAPLRCELIQLASPGYESIAVLDVRPTVARLFPDIAAEIMGAGKDGEA